METPKVSRPGARVPWNKGELAGQKPPLKLPEIWAIGTQLQISMNVRELAMFNLAIDSKLRACDLTRLRVQDIGHGSHVGARATVMQQKTQRPVQFEITEPTRQSVEAWIAARHLKSADYLFPSRLHTLQHLSTRQYARLVHRWVGSIGLGAFVAGVLLADSDYRHKVEVDMAPFKAYCSVCFLLR